MLVDSLRTNNLPTLQGETNRLLIGSYQDPLVGAVQSTVFTNIRTSSLTTFIEDDESFDSLILQLRFDFYVYGAPGASIQRYSVHELTSELDITKAYYFNSTATYDPTPLGTGEVVINSEYFKEEFADPTTDSVFTIKIKLNQEFGQRLFDSVDPTNENYTNFTKFKTNFKGLAIVAEQSDKIVGFSPIDLNTALFLYYHNPEVNKTLAFTISQGINFSQITADRSSTDLANLNQFFTDYTETNNRYVQAGASVVTKLDFTKFYEYMDSIPNAIINSAELSIDPIVPPDGFSGPFTLSLAQLKSNSRYRTVKAKQDTSDLVAFGGSLVISDADRIFAGTDQGGLLQLGYSETNNNYRSFPTLFFQRLLINKNNRLPFWALQSVSPPQGKSVNRIVFPKENIKLKVYYTRPVTSENQ